MRCLVLLPIALFVASSLQSQMLPYFNDFESGVEGLSHSGDGALVLFNPTEIPDRTMLGPFSVSSVSIGFVVSPPYPSLVDISLDLYLFGSWEGNSGADAGPDKISVSVFSDKLMSASFSLTDGLTQSFPENDPASNPPFTGAAESGETWARYHLELSTPPQGTMVIVFEGDGLQGLGDESWAMDNLAIQASGGWQLTVEKLGSGSGVVTSEPAGINCGISCQASYPDGTEIELSASPGGSSLLGGWSGCTANGNTCSLTITADTEISVTFDSDSPAVLAAFEFSPAQPVAGEPTQFTDTSTGVPTSFTWDFGDGSQPSSEQNPSHTFAAPGDYEVTLEASNTGSLDATSQFLTVIQGKPPLGADFTFSPLNPTIGETVSFIDTSVGLPTAWQWDFGDGSPLSHEQNPEHAFGEGVFSVTLEVSRDSGQDADIEITTITVGAEPVAVFANFTFAPVVPAVGAEVQFFDLSTGNLTSWLWSFADGSESTDPNPTHTFLEPGLYDVLLTVSDGQTIDATISTVQVVDAELHADFEITPEAPVAGEVVRFLDRSTGGVTSRSWDFGDGSGSTESEALHTYEEPGAYTVQLEVSGGAASGASTAVASVSKRIVIGDPTSGVTLLSDFYSGREGRDDVRVLVRRGGDPAASASVRLEVSDGSALRGSDYAAPPSVLLQWSEGDSSVQEVVIDLIDDAEGEATESLSVELTQPEGVTLGEPAAASVAVLDDDFVAEPEEEQVGDSGAEEPRVITDANGNTAVVWREIDGGGFDVLAQVFGPDGAPLGGPFPVSTSGNPERSNPVAAWDAAGNLFVTWVEGSGQGVRTANGSFSALTAAAPTILGRFFSPGGQPQGAPLPLSGAPTGGASAPNIAADPSGEVVVTWEEPGGPRARVVKRNRQPDPLVLAIEAASIEGAAKPEVDKLSTGDFVAVWKSSVGTGGIRARLFAENGAPRGAPFFVAPNAAADNPAVAVTADGGFVVVWDAPTAAQGLDVFGQLFEFDGSPASSPFVVNGSTAGDQRQARVDANSAGDFAVAFESSETSGARGATGALTAQGQSIVARFFDPTAAPLGGDVPVSESEAGIEPAHPDVAIDDSDTTTVVYERRGPGNSPEGGSDAQGPSADRGGGLRRVEHGRPVPPELALPRHRPLAGPGRSSGLRPRDPAHVGHRLLLVLRPGERRARAQGARRLHAQRPLLGVRRRPHRRRDRAGRR